jgi:protein-tyrosine phosphatase
MILQLILTVIVIVILLLLAAFAALVAMVMWRKQRAHYPDAETLILPSPADARVERQPNDDLLIYWNEVQTARIYAGTNPDTIAEVELIGEGASPICISGLDAAARYYFALHFPDGRRIVTAERIVPLQGGINFRDLGGYQTTDGRRVRWGRVYRSGSLGGLSEADQTYLAHMGLKSVCDLRTVKEAERNPDHLPAGARYTQIPIYGEGEAERYLTIRHLLMNLDRLDTLLLASYTDSLIDQKAQVFGTALRRLSDAANLPGVTHCTAGKDRAGLTAALLLLALGVPEDTVIADYTLTNHFYGIIRDTVRADIAPLSVISVSVDDLKALFTANPATLRAALDHIRTRYGSVNAYLRDQAGLDDATLERLKSTLLT